MKQLKIDNEALLFEQYAQPDFLPPLWRVIFQEAMRGHHIIFPKAIVQMMTDEGARKQTLLKDHALEEFCVHLFAAPDLNSIRSMIHFLSIDEQKQLFVIYAQLMKTIRDVHKSQLN